MSFISSNLTETYLYYIVYIIFCAFRSKWNYKKKRQNKSRALKTLIRKWRL